MSIKRGMDLSSQRLWRVLFNHPKRENTFGIRGKLSVKLNTVFVDEMEIIKLCKRFRINSANGTLGQLKKMGRLHRVVVTKFSD